MYQHQSLVNHTHERLETFHFNGQEYRVNAVVKLKSSVKHCWDATPKMVQLIRHIVTDCTHHTWVYAFWFETGVIKYYNSHESPENIIDYVIMDGKERFDTELSDCCPEDKKAEFSKELCIAWCLYIPVMVFLMIFRDFIVGWIFVTVFFVYWYKTRKASLNYYAYGFDYNKTAEMLKNKQI